jgi:hypothetical protein
VRTDSGCVDTRATIEAAVDVDVVGARADAERVAPQVRIREKRPSMLAM